MSNSPGVDNPAGSTLLERATLLYNIGRYDGAVKAVRGHLALEPSSSSAHSLLAICLLKTEHLPKSKAYFEDSEALRSAHSGVRLGPDRAYAHYAVALVLDSLGLMLEAEEAIEEALRLDPADVDYHEFAARCHSHFKRWSDALAAADRGLSYQPEDVDCAMRRASCLWDLGRNEDALLAGEYVLKLDPQNALAHALIGWLFVQKGDSRRAELHFRVAIRQAPDLDSARDGYIEALKARTLFSRLVMARFRWLADRPAWIFGSVVVALWLGAHAMPRVARIFPICTIPVQIVLTLYFLINLAIQISEPLLDLMVPMARYARKDNRAAKKGKWSFLEVAYLMSLALLPFNVTSDFGLALSLFVDFLLLVALIREAFGSRTYLPYGIIVLIVIVMIFLFWLHG